jgi:hypothetical protein
MLGLRATELDLSKEVRVYAITNNECSGGSPLKDGSSEIAFK